MIEIEYMISKYGPLLTTCQLSDILHRPVGGLKKSSRDKRNPLYAAKRKIGRKIYFSTQEIAKLVVGNGGETENIKKKC